MGRAQGGVRHLEALRAYFLNQSSYYVWWGLTLTQNVLLKVEHKRDFCICVLICAVLTGVVIPPNVRIYHILNHSFTISVVQGVPQVHGEYNWTGQTTSAGLAYTVIRSQLSAVNNICTVWPHSKKNKFKGHPAPPQLPSLAKGKAEHLRLPSPETHHLCWQLRPPTLHIEIRSRYGQNREKRNFYYNQV